MNHFLSAPYKKVHATVPFLFYAYRTCVNNQAHITNVSTFGVGNKNILVLKFTTGSVHPTPIVTEDCEMAKYKPFDLVLASFQGYPLWPSVVIKTTKDQKKSS